MGLISLPPQLAYVLFPLRPVNLLLSLQRLNALALQHHSGSPPLAAYSILPPSPDLSSVSCAPLDLAGPLAAFHGDLGKQSREQECEGGIVNWAGEVYAEQTCEGGIVDRVGEAYTIPI